MQVGTFFMPILQYICGDKHPVFQCVVVEYVSYDFLDGSKRFSYPRGKTIELW